MSFGRPAAIPDDYVILDLPCHVNMGDPMESIDPRREISLNFFNATMLVCLIKPYLLSDR